jgi:hypothetical protein
MEYVIFLGLLGVAFFAGAFYGHATFAGLVTALDTKIDALENTLKKYEATASAEVSKVTSEVKTEGTTLVTEIKKDI